MWTVTWVVPVSMVAVSPTVRPLAFRNAVLTSTWPGASYQRPVMTPYPIQEESLANPQALT